MDVDPIHEEQKAQRAAAEAAKPKGRHPAKKRAPRAGARESAKKPKGHKVGAEDPASAEQRRERARNRASERRNRGINSANLPVPHSGWGGGGPPSAGERVELPRYEPNDQDALNLAIMRANGYTVEACCRHFGLTKETLEHHYPNALHHGFEIISAQIANRVALGAISGDQKDQHFWLKARAGWGPSSGGTGPGAPGAERAFEPMTLVANAAKAATGPSGIPAPGPNGKVKVSMVIGIAGDQMGDKEPGTL